MLLMVSEGTSVKDDQSVQVECKIPFLRNIEAGRDRVGWVRSGGGS
jgi:hypothetical protein